MRTYAIILILGLSLAHTQSKAQAVDNIGIERDLNKEKYIRLNYGNDYFTATDYYLTQTIYLELVHPILSKNPINYLMFRPKSMKHKYGLAGEHNGYTPTDYVPANILYGDRPFAATLSLKSFLIATDSLKRQRIASAISIGVLGPAAGGGAMQTYIHEHTPNAIPQGWPNQIANDLVLQYQMTYTKQVFDWQHIFNLSANATGYLGSINDKANIGLTALLGLFQNPYYSAAQQKRKLRFYIYDHPEVNAVAYDATMEGGLFNKSSPYTIAGHDISRIVFRNNWGIVLQYQNLYLEYYQSYMSKEFASGLDMHNGGIQIGIGL